MAAQELYTTTLFTDTNLVSYYRMGGDSNDWKGSNNGTDTSITYDTANGKFGLGANGTAPGYINLGSSSTLNLGSADFTLSAWITTPSSFAADRGILARRSSVGGGAGTVGVCLFIQNASGKLAGYDGSTSGLCTTALSTNTQYHVAFVFTKSSSALDFYLNGSFVNTVTMTNWTSISDVTSLLAAEKDGSTKFVGGIDDVAIFNRKLTSGEISNIASGGLVTRGMGGALLIGFM